MRRGYVQKSLVEDYQDSSDDSPAVKESMWPHMYRCARSVSSCRPDWHRASSCSWRRQGTSTGPDALPFSKSYLVTGNYVVGGVDLAAGELQSRGNGFMTGTIPMSGVPGQRRHPRGVSLLGNDLRRNIAQVDGAKFRGSPITVVKASSRR